MEKKNSKIIILPGKLNSSFIQNELPVLKNKFDEICFFSYPDDKEKCDEIARTYNINYKFINYKKFSLCLIKNLWKWSFCTHVKREIKSIKLFLPQNIKKIGYVFWYGLFAVQAYGVIESEIKNFDGDIYLYSYWLSRPAYVISLFNLQRNSNIKKIFSRAHRYDLYEERNRMNYLPFRNFIDNNLDIISFISEDGKKYYLNRKKENSKVKCQVSYLGTYKNTNMKKEMVSKNTIIIASCSAITSVKRLDLVIEVIKYLKNYYKVKWIHYGTGNLKKEIECYAEKELDCRNYVFKGHFDNKNLLGDYIKEDVDFLINMSDSEGLPVSIIEAMSIGIPVIARQVGGIDEIVQESNGCLLKETENFEIKKEQIKKFIKMRLENPKLYEEYSKNAFVKWKESFSAESNYNNFFENIKNNKK